VKTPEIYDMGGDRFGTYFIETERRDMCKAAREWAEVHNYFLKEPLEESRYLMKHDPREVSNYVLREVDMFGKLKSKVKKRLCDVEMKQDIETLLHGDLQGKNMRTFRGKNYYFDFELGGLGHPGRDIASMIISAPDKKEELIRAYGENFEYGYPGFSCDIDTWLILRAAQLYIIFSNRQGGGAEKPKIKNKLSGIIEGLV